MEILRLSALDHAFVVPAYGNSAHLRICLESLRGQDTPTSEIVVSTSTPHEGLLEICVEYGARLHTHTPNRGIAADWNEALNATRCELITLAHQDDIYLPGFLGGTLDAASRGDGVMLVFTGYREYSEEGVRAPSIALKMKRILVELAFLGGEVADSRFTKTNLLRFGCPIPCPSVTLRRDRLPPDMRFDPRYRVNLDWDFWLRLAQLPDAAFACVREPLMLHRIHRGSETSAGIADGTRAREDSELFGRVWPGPVAAMMARAYSRAYAYNSH